MVEFTDKELADRVVALGVGRCTSSGYYNLSWDGDVGAHIFVRDWRVAGALMEKYPDGFSYWFDNKWKAGVVDLEADTMVSNESLPRAIIEACCEALDG